MNFYRPMDDITWADRERDPPANQELLVTLKRMLGRRNRAGYTTVVVKVKKTTAMQRRAKTVAR